MKSVPSARRFWMSASGQSGRTWPSVQLYSRPSAMSFWYHARMRLST